MSSSPLTVSPAVLDPGAASFLGGAGDTAGRRWQPAGKAAPVACQASRRKARPWWGRLRHRLEYACLRGCSALAGRVPRPVWLWCGARLGDLLCLAGFYRRVVRRNMEFAGVGPAETRRRVTRHLYRNIGRYAADFLRPNDMLPPVRVHGKETLRRQAGADQGGIVLFAHLGNWEILPALLQQVGHDVVAIAKPMKNPLVEGWLQHRRRSVGVSCAIPRAALRHCLRVLRGGALVALAIDQYPGRHGTPAPFLGRATRTVRTSAGLAVHTGCPVTGAYAILGADGVYDVWVEPIPPAPAGPGRDPVNAALQTHSAAISSWVAAYPEHYFGWFHRRFRDSLRY